jgi:hypothetical protein
MEHLIDRMDKRSGAIVLALSLTFPGTCLAYRPFDSTGAAVASKGIAETELMGRSQRASW